MAFLLTNWTEANVSFNCGATSNTSPAEGGPNLYTYQSYTDNVAAIGASNYFAPVVFSVQVGDIIIANGTDASNLFVIASVDTDTGTVTTSSFTAAGSVGTANIENGAVTNAKVNAAAAIDFSKLAALSSGNILVGNVSNVPTSVAVTGDVTLTNAGVTAIGAGVIVNNDINASAAIAFSKLATLTSGNILVGSAGNVPTSVAVTGDITIDNLGVTTIGTGVIVNADINASAAIAYSKMAALPSTQILVGNVSNVATAVAMTGDITIGNTGVTAIGSGVIVNADVNASAAIDYSKLATLASGNVLVGSAGGVATSVALTGDVTVSNAGVTAIGSGVIVNADINGSAAIDYSKLATLSSGNILVGSAGNVATSVAVTGDIGITNAGLTSISSGVIVNADVNTSAAIDFSKLATLTSGNILVGSAGNVATSVAMSGDVTISNAGVASLASSAITSAKMSPAVLQYTFVPISAAQFNGMYAAPMLLVAAPGANKILVLDKVELLMTFVSANFANGGVAAVQYDSTANGAGLIASTTLSAATFFAAASTGFMFNTGVVPQTFTNCVNKGLYLSNITGAFDTGDSTFVAHIWYKVITTV